MSSYILLFKKNNSEINFLICHSHYGIKYNDKAVKTYCKVGTNYSIKNVNVLRKEVEENIKMLSEAKKSADINLYVNPRPKKNTDKSLYYISDNKYINNFLGGQLNKDESPVNGLLRELEEEILLNSPNKTKFLEDIKSKLTNDNKVVVDKRVIFLIDYESLSEFTKEEISKMEKNPKEYFSKKEEMCGIPDVEIGEINCLKWVDIDKLKRTFENKFMKDGILEKFINKKIILTGGHYYEKYIKYKIKYLNFK